MEQWKPLAEGQTPRRYKRGQMIYLQGTYPDCFYYLISGQVRSFLSSRDGEELTLTVHHSGDLMGEASFFDRCPRVSSAVALEDCQVVTVDRQRLEMVFHRHPELAQPMLEYLARTVRLLSDHVNAASLPALCRVARHLLSLPRAEDGTTPCTHEGIGQAVGVSRITVSRVIASMVEKGLIESGYKQIRILSPEKLLEWAEP